MLGVEDATTVKVVVTDVSPVADAVSVIEPAAVPVTVSLAMPALAVGLPSPLTVPVPPVLANVTTVALSVVTTFWFASRISAVMARVPPELRFAVEEVIARCVAAPGVMLKPVLVSPVSAGELLAVSV
jgi:hypothetical protein